MKKLILILITLAIVLNSCSKELLKEYKTKNVIIIVVDGVRYSESGGDTTHQHTSFFQMKLLVLAWLIQLFTIME